MLASLRTPAQSRPPSFTILLVAETFKNALLALHDTNILQALPDKATGFIETSDTDFDAVRREKANAERFAP